MTASNPIAAPNRWQVLSEELGVKLDQAQVDETTSDYDREKLQERVARLIRGVARIKVGIKTRPIPPVDKDHGASATAQHLD